MKLLIVEDDPNVVDALSDDLKDILEPGELTICRSRDTALAAISHGIFDYAVLDLKIPTADDKLDAEVDHGRAVYDQLRADLPGTPVCFMTGFATDDFIMDRFQDAEMADIWGAGIQAPMLRLIPKKRLNEVAPLIQAVKAEIAATDDIELIATGLPPLDCRVVRIFGRRHHAGSLLVEELSGGLSDVRVRRVTIRDCHGSVHLVTAARIGIRTEIKNELQGYNADIVRLPNGRFSVHAGEVFAGAGPLAGVFYRLLPDLESLAAVVRSDPTRASRVVNHLQPAERIWTEGRPQSARRVQDIRRYLVSDEEMQNVKQLLEGIDWESFENRNVQARICTQHGDLHCGNVMVDAHDEPVMIDYACVGEGTSCLDPITLEMSVLFHPDSKTVSGDWPTPAQVDRWDDLDTFTRGSPSEAFLRAARHWATEVAAGRREFYATAYALSVRQLKYADTDKVIAQGIIRAVVRAFQQT